MPDCYRVPFDDVGEGADLVAALSRQLASRQVDLPDGKKSGLREVRRILEHVEDLQFFDFSDKDVVRHPLVAKIVTAYDKIDREKKEAEDRKAAETAAS